MRDASLLHFILGAYPVGNPLNIQSRSVLYGHDRNACHFRLNNAFKMFGGQAAAGRQVMA